MFVYNVFVKVALPLKLEYSVHNKKKLEIHSLEDKAQSSFVKSDEIVIHITSD